MDTYKKVRVPDLAVWDKVDRREAYASFMQEVIEWNSDAEVRIDLCVCAPQNRAWEFDPWQAQL